jgi:hypothetical protein
VPLSRCHIPYYITRTQIRTTEVGSPGLSIWSTASEVGGTILAILIMSRNFREENRPPSRETKLGSLKYEAG